MCATLPLPRCRCRAASRSRLALRGTRRSPRTRRTRRFSHDLSSRRAAAGGRLAHVDDVLGRAYGERQRVAGAELLRSPGRRRAGAVDRAARLRCALKVRSADGHLDRARQLSVRCERGGGGGVGAQDQGRRGRRLLDTAAEVGFVGVAGGAPLSSRARRASRCAARALQRVLRPRDRRRAARESGERWPRPLTRAERCVEALPRRDRVGRPDVAVARRDHVEARRLR